MRENCILNCDSPSYPPEMPYEYIQCGCKYCRITLAVEGYYLDNDGKLIEPGAFTQSLD